MRAKTNPPDLAIAWAEKLYEKHGIYTIPIAKDAKKPLIQTSNWWGPSPPKPVPVGLIRQMRPNNIAVQTGVVSGVVVIDVDDPKACQGWFSSVPRLPSTWTVKTGGGGLHLYYRLPRWLEKPLPKVVLWKGTEKHQEVALIGERAMAITAPSRFTGKMYKWGKGPNPIHCSPAYLPAWIVKHVISMTKEIALQNSPVVIERTPWTFPAGLTTPEFDEVTNKLETLVAAGLRISGRPNASGWIPCYRPDKEDRNPSASVREDGSVVWTPDGSLSFRDALSVLNQSRS